ncbi:MAG: glycosyltransferase family 4 protein, partial [Ilumatobacteraceae bacterium]
MTRRARSTPRPGIVPDPGVDASLDIPALGGRRGAGGGGRVDVLAGRDLDDPDAGGSEVHADEFMRRWAAAGLEIVHRTSAARGLPPTSARNGYTVERHGGRLGVFPRTIATEALRQSAFDAVVEIWNGVPWMGPVWCRRPRLTFLHHVHGPMWDQILPRPFATLGKSIETRWAPPFYRRSLTLTPSDATRDELLELGFEPSLVRAVPNGVGESFSPGGARTERPSVVCVGRFAPVKRHEALLDAAESARRRVPDLEVTLVGDGPLRPELEAWVERHDARQWVHLAGRLDADALVEVYRRSWIVASASLAEGWGLTLTEAAACGTPAVATDINGHRSSVVDGVTGVLAPLDRLGDALADVLVDHRRREALAVAALARARTLTWEASATGVLRGLVDVVEARLS